MLTTHPAPGNGMGRFMPAVWSIPENPIQAAYGLGFIVDGLYTLPQNPIVADILAKRKMAEEIQKNPVGLSCGISTCPCDVGLCGVSGTVDDLMAKVTSAMPGGWQNWAVFGGGALLLLMIMMSPGGRRRSEMAVIRSEYKSKVASAKARYRAARHGVKHPPEYA
jgi:hypothetical protein